MRKLVLIFLPLLLVGCDGLGSKKIKTITELTNKLALESNEPIIVSQDLKTYNVLDNLGAYKSYKLSDKKISLAPFFSCGNIYVIDESGKIIAFSKADKKILWTRSISDKKLSNNYIGGGISHNDNKLFITNGSRFLTVINSKTGHEILRKEFSDIIRIKPVIIDKQTILVQTVNNHAYAYDFYNDKVLWQHEDISETLISSRHVAPIIYNSNALISYSSGKTVSLNLKEGRENWSLSLFQRNTGGEDINLPNFELNTSSCAPVIEDNSAYIANNSGIITKVNLLTGQILWQAQADSVQSMIIEGNSLFITNNAKQIAAISTSLGQVKWLAELGNVTKDDKYRRKSMRFLEPMIGKTSQGFVISVFASDSNIYNFEFDDKNHKLIKNNTVKGLKNINYVKTTCCGDTYILTDKHIIFLEKIKKLKVISRR